MSYRDILKKGFHIETQEDNKEEYLLFTKDHRYGKKVHEKISFLLCGLYYTCIKRVEHVAYKVIFENVNALQTWHDRLGHNGIGRMRKITSNSIVHNLLESRFFLNFLILCAHLVPRES